MEDSRGHGELGWGKGEVEGWVGWIEGDKRGDKQR